MNRKTTTQRRVEGQMKSCVTNNVLPIPREIYFSGYAVFTLRNDIFKIFSIFFFFLFFSSHSSHFRWSNDCLPKTENNSNWSNHDDVGQRKTLHSRKPWESNFFTDLVNFIFSFMLLRFVFSWIQKRETAEISILKFVLKPIWNPFLPFTRATELILQFGILFHTKSSSERLNSDENWFGSISLLYFIIWLLTSFVSRSICLNDCWKKKLFSNFLVDSHGGKLSFDCRLWVKIFILKQWSAKLEAMDRLALKYVLAWKLFDKLFLPTMITN